MTTWDSDLEAPPTAVQPVPTRKHLRAEADGVDLQSSYLKGPLVNMSREGFSVRTRRRPVVGREYSCRLVMDGLAAEVVGRVQWCRLRETARTPGGDVVAIYHAGLSLVCGDEASYEGMLIGLLRRNGKTG